MLRQTENLTVADLMTANPVTVGPDDNLTEVNELMMDRAIRHVPVVDDEGNLVGLISHRDLVRSALYAFNEIPYSEQKGFLEGTLVHSVMTNDPETIEADASVADAARIILENKFGCLPVVEGLQLVGILTESDFVKHLLLETEQARKPLGSELSSGAAT
jgi:CBS domain-containing membrane protein